MTTPTETLRAILEAIPQPGGLEALAELETEMAELRSVMGAAAPITHLRHASDNEPRTGHTGPNHCADPRR